MRDHQEAALVGIQADGADLLCGIFSVSSCLGKALPVPVPQRSPHIVPVVWKAPAIADGEHQGGTLAVDLYGDVLYEHLLAAFIALLAYQVLV